MALELLSRIPISGTVRERHFHVSGGSNAWVRFDDEAEGAWVGVFGAGDVSRFTAVAPYGDHTGRTVLVIAGGQGYVVDARGGALLRRTPWDYAYAVAAPLGRDFVLVADTTHIWVAYRDRDVLAVSAVRHPFDHWAERDADRPPTRVAVDGIVFDAPGEEAVSGRAWQMDGWYAFRLYYDRLLVEPVPSVARDHGAFAADELPKNLAQGNAPAAAVVGRVL